MKATSTANDNILSGTPFLKFVDRTAFETNGLGDCFKFVSEFEFAVAFAGIDSGAYKIIRNFKDCA